MKIGTTRISAFALGLVAGLGCSSTSTHTLESTSSTAIPPAGGQALSPSGTMTLTFAAGAFPRETTVLITEDRSQTLPGQVGPIYHLQPSGLVVTDGLNMRMLIPAELRGRGVQIARVEGSTLVAVPGSHVVDDATAEAPIVYFSSYALFTQVTVQDDGGPRVADGWVTGSCEGDGGWPTNVGTIKACGMAEVEPNDSIATAQPIIGGLDQGAAVDANFDGTEDNYRLTIPAGTTAGIFGFASSQLDYYNCSGINVTLALIDPSGRTILSQVGCEGFNIWGDPRVNNLPGGDYIVRVTGTGAPYHYYLELWVLSQAATGALSLDAGVGD